MIMFHSVNHKCLKQFYLNVRCIRSMCNKILLRESAMIETINDELKNLVWMEHTRHHSFPNFSVNLIGEIAAYRLFI